MALAFGLSLGMACGAELPSLLIQLNDFALTGSLTNREVLIAPLKAGASGSTIATEDWISRRTSTSGTVLLTSVVPGDYQIMVRGPKTNTLVLIRVPQTNGVVNASGAMITEAEPAMAYTTSAADAKFATIDALAGATNGAARSSNTTLTGWAHIRGPLTNLGKTYLASSPIITEFSQLPQPGEDYRLLFGLDGSPLYSSSAYTLGSLNAMATTNQINELVTNSAINVRLPPYLAPNDGATDATVAIQAAIDEALASGRNLHFPPGEYLISSNYIYGSQTACLQFTNLAGRELAIDGYGAKVKIADGSTVQNGFFGPPSGAGKVTVQGLLFDDNIHTRNTNVALGALFSANAVSIAIFRDCTFTNIIRNGLYSSATEDTLIDNCKFYGSCPGTNGAQIYVDDGHIKIVNCLFNGAGDWGPDIHPARRQGIYEAATCDSVLVEGNKFVNCAIGCDTRSPNQIIVGNTFIGGINGTHTNFTVGQLHNLYYPAIIKGNIFKDFTNQICIWLTDSTNSVVEGNWIMSGGRDYYLQRMIDCYGGGSHIISGNTIFLPQSGTLQHTIIDTSHSLSTNNLAINNQIYGGRFAHKAATNEVQQLVWISGNSLSGTAYPFYDGTTLGVPDGVKSDMRLGGLANNGVEFSDFGPLTIKAAQGFVGINTGNSIFSELEIKSAATNNVNVVLRASENGSSTVRLYSTNAAGHGSISYGGIGNMAIANGVGNISLQAKTYLELYVNSLFQARLNTIGLGLGTNSPQARLHAVGTGSTADLLRLGTTAADRRFAVDTNGIMAVTNMTGAPADAATVIGWLPISVNGTNAFMPIYK